MSPRTASGYNPPMEHLTQMQLIDWLSVAAGYLAGSISAAILTCKALGLSDPRQSGSKNPGATNVMRLHGKKAAIITLLGDVCKGVLPVLLARALGLSFEVQILIGVAAFLGHLYPLYFGLKGGKGVATAYGILFALDYRVGLACGAIWLVVFGLRRISSLSALTAFLLLPAVCWLLTKSVFFCIATIVISTLIFWRHRSNIKQLLSNVEK